MAEGAGSRGRNPDEGSNAESQSKVTRWGTDDREGREATNKVGEDGVG